MKRSSTDSIEPPRGVRHRDYMFHIDGRKCVYCGFDFLEKPKFMRFATEDHLIPTQKRGKNALRNRVLACHWCNAEKKDFVLKDTQIDELGADNIVSNLISNQWIEVEDEGIVVIRGKEKEYAFEIYKTFLEEKIGAGAADVPLWQASPDSLPDFVYRNGR